MRFQSGFKNSSLTSKASTSTFSLRERRAFGLHNAKALASEREPALPQDTDSSQAGRTSPGPSTLTTLTGIAISSAGPKCTEAPDLLGISNDDCGNSKRLIRLHGDDMRYSHSEKSWRLWDRSRWRKDDTDQARARAESVIQELVREAQEALETQAAKVIAFKSDPEIGFRKDKRAASHEPDPRVRQLLSQMFDMVDTLHFAKKCLNRGPLTNMLAEARRSLGIMPEELDVDPWLLNFSDATIDLRTGRPRAHDRADYITRRIDFPYRDGNETCPQFLRFLNWAMHGEQDPDRASSMVEYLQMCLGYSFTGLSKEKAMFICFGSEGDNGKTVLLHLLRRIAGDYGATIRVSSLMAKKDSNAVSSDMADLRGARYVMTSETEPGQKLSQSTLKFLTQGQGETRARRLRENWITFHETHSIWVDCNTLPAMPADVEDPALRRLIPIEFRAQIARDKIDRDLGDRLYEAERAGIAAWIVAGAVKWFKVGQKLNHPAEIDVARDHWRRADPFVRFIEERCATGSGNRISARSIHREFLRWWATSGLHGEPLNETVFGTRMARRFPEGKHTEAGWIYFGVGLRAFEPR
jgi:putative DNA primase/helicase